MGVRVSLSINSAGEGLTEKSFEADFPIIYTHVFLLSLYISSQPLERATWLWWGWTISNRYVKSFIFTISHKCGLMLCFFCLVFVWFILVNTLQVIAVCFVFFSLKTYWPERLIARVTCKRNIHPVGKWYVCCSTLVLYYYFTTYPSLGYLYRKIYCMVYDTVRFHIC